MVDAALLSRVKTMNPADRLEFIGAVWDTLSPADAPVTEEDKALLDPIWKAIHKTRVLGWKSRPDHSAGCRGLYVDQGVRRKALRHCALGRTIFDVLPNEACL